MLYVPDGEVGHEVNYRLGQAKAALRDLRPVLNWQQTHRHPHPSEALRVFDH